MTYMVRLMPRVSFVLITCNACGRNEKVVNTAARYPIMFIGGSSFEYNALMITGFT
jgi:hypothetical protein